MQSTTKWSISMLRGFGMRLRRAAAFAASERITDGGNVESPASPAA